ncbi:DUF4175 family protein [Cerasicoccus fimbriatus]|uniref:DUF4175 family protein n=1 Tax=Cerasicoccus fimbriatus TaxID=3014554 RepID=UPI0022B46B3E|nr:DUF4175 family protein [Cerasicoccus sp. TK19100]
MKEKLQALYRKVSAEAKRRWEARPKLTPPAPTRPVHLENREFGFIGKIDGVRKRYLFERALYGLSLVAAVFLAFFALRCFIDWWLVMPWFLRFLALVAEILFIGGAFYKFVIWPFKHPPSDEEAALLVERANPELKSRLISTLQLNQPGALGANTAVSMVRALNEQTETMAQETKFGPAVPLKEAGKMFLRGLFITAAAVTGFVLAGDTGLALMRRALLSWEPVPRKTMIYGITGDTVIGFGDDLDIQVRTEGVIPEGGTIEIDYESGRSMEFPIMVSESDPRIFHRMLESVPESFEYTVFAGDGQSETYTVRTKDKPVLLKVEARYTPPPYTGKRTRTLSLQELDVLPGGKLELIANSNQELSGGDIHQAGLGQKVPMEVVGANDSQARGSVDIPLEGLTGVSVRVFDEAGVPSTATPAYPVRIIEDQAPTIDIVFPIEIQQLVTPDANMLLSFKATDDNRLGKVELHYSINRGDEQSFELDLGAQPGASVHNRYDWPLGELDLSINDIIEYWVVATDTNDITGPGSSASRRFVARVVTPEEKQAELVNRVLDKFNQISGVASGQRETSQELGKIIERKE